MKKKDDSYIYNEHDNNQVKAIYKKRRKKRRMRRIRLVGVILVIVLIVSFFISDLSKIQSIKITGNALLTSDEIVESLSIKVHQSFTFFNTSSGIKSDVEDVPFIKSAKVNKDLLGRVNIEVTETTPAGYASINNILYVFDDQGDVKEDKNNTLLQYVQRTPKLNNFDDDHLKQFIKEYVKIPSVVRNKISDINYAPAPGDDDRCEFYMNDGKVLYVRTSKMAQQLADDNYAKKIAQFPNYKYYDFVGKYVYVSN